MKPKRTYKWTAKDYATAIGLHHLRRRVPIERAKRVEPEGHAAAGKDLWEGQMSTGTPTPRTNAACWRENRGASSEVVLSGFARTLERELNRAETELAVLRKRMDSVVKYCDERIVPDYKAVIESLKQDNTALRAALEKAREYIKGVNEDCPVGTDDDRDNLVEELSAALAKGETKS